MPVINKQTDLFICVFSLLETILFQIEQLLSEADEMSTEPCDARPQKLNETLYNLQQKMLNSSRSERKALKLHIADLDDRIARFHKLTQKYKAY